MHRSKLIGLYVSLRPLLQLFSHRLTPTVFINVENCRRSPENRRRMVRFNGKILPDEKVSPRHIAMGRDLEGG